jgi:hypothetical protein
MRCADQDGWRRFRVAPDAARCADIEHGRISPKDDTRAGLQQTPALRPVATSDGLGPLKQMWLCHFA